MVGMSKQSNALGLLVEQVGAANDWSRRDIARRAQARGYELSHQRISQLCLGDLPGIQAEKLYALAAGLGISPARVAVAVLEAMGITLVDAAVSPAESIMQAPDLSEDTRRALLAILRSGEDSNARRRGA